MPVEVSLELMVSLPDTRPLWPDKFRELVEAVETDPGNTTRLGVLADWCDEHGEGGMSRAFRWLMRRSDVSLTRSADKNPRWRLGGAPEVLETVKYPRCRDTAFTTSAWAVADLADRLRLIDEVAK